MSPPRGRPLPILKLLGVLGRQEGAPGPSSGFVEGQHWVLGPFQALVQILSLPVPSSSHRSPGNWPPTEGPPEYTYLPGTRYPHCPVLTLMVPSACSSQRLSLGLG